MNLLKPFQFTTTKSSVPRFKLRPFRGLSGFLIYKILFSETHFCSNLMLYVAKVLKFFTYLILCLSPFLFFKRLTLAFCMPLLKAVTVTLLKDWWVYVPSWKCGLGHLVKGEGWNFHFPQSPGYSGY
jgi:hypothetical protein